MMLKRKINLRERSGPGIPQPGNRAGSSVFAVLAGVAVMCAGTTAFALASSHADAVGSSGDQCQVLPSAPSTPPGTTPPISPGGNNSGTGSSPSGGTNSTPPSANPTEICVNVGAATASVHPGQVAEYLITVEPQDGTAGDVTVQISLPAGQSTAGLPSPTFSVCGNGSGTQTCTIGGMHAGQTQELEAEVSVPSSSSAGGTVILAATVTAAAPGATATGSATGSATVAVTANPSTGSGGGHTSGGGHGSGHSGGHSSGSSGGTSGSTVGTSDGSGGTSADTTPFDNLPPLTGGSGTSTGGTSSDLFPTINPSSPSTPTNSGGSHSAPRKPYKATTVADVLPLNTGQISGQVAGLIVLGLGILLVFARISLRKPRSDSKQ